MFSRQADFQRLRLPRLTKSHQKKYRQRVQAVVQLQPGVGVTALECHHLKTTEDLFGYRLCPPRRIFGCYVTARSELRYVFWLLLSWGCFGDTSDTDSLRFS